MTIAEALARPLIAGVFIYGGIDTLRNPGSKVDVADPILEPASKATGLGPEQLVAINAGVQVVAGVALAVGILPRPAAALLAASLVPTTLAGHRFWEQDDPAAKRAHVVHLLEERGDARRAGPRRDEHRRPALHPVARPARGPPPRRDGGGHPRAPAARRLSVRATPPPPAPRARCEVAPHALPA